MNQPERTMNRNAAGSKPTAAQKYAQQARHDLDFAVDLIDGLRLKPAPAIEGGAEVPVSRFNNAVYLADGLHEVSTGDALWNSAEVFDLWPVHARCMVARPGSEHAAVLRALDTVTVRHTRGRVKRPMPRMLRFSSAHVDPNGTGTTAETFYGVNPDGSLVNITNINGRAIPADLALQQALAQLVAGLGLHMRYSWSVEVKTVGSNFGIRVPTSPDGSRKLLALRDVEAGQARRRALRHWVTAHGRRRTAEAAIKDIQVRAHLRGVTPFAWEDLEGVVRPSDYDLEQNTASR